MRIMQQLEITMELDTINLYQIVVLAGGLVGTYIKLTQEISKNKSRIISLEKQNDDLTITLKQLAADIAEIKLILARKQIDS
jgi:hypothetical protein